MNKSSQYWKRAQERLASQGKALAPLTNLLTAIPSLANRIALLGQGACDCNTKSPDVHMHLPTCRYRQAMELADEAEVDAEAGDALVRDARAVLDRLIQYSPDHGVDEFLDAIRDARLLVAKIDGAE